jgi:hypothetical protein
MARSLVLKGHKTTTYPGSVLSNTPDLALCEASEGCFGQEFTLLGFIFFWTMAYAVTALIITFVSSGARNALNRYRTSVNDCIVRQVR